MFKINTSEPFDGLFPFLAPDADSGDGVSADNPDDLNDDDDIDLRDVFGTEGPDNDDDDPDDQNEEDEDENQAEEKDEEPGKEPGKEPEPKTVTMTQAELDAKIEARLQRDRAKREREAADAARFEAEIKRQNDEEADYLGKFYNRKVQTFINMGFTEEDATAEADFETRREQRLLQLDRRDRAREQESRLTQNMMAYQAEKAAFTAKFPLAAKYADEIESVGKGGSIPGLTFETAMNYVLGQKVASGELLKNVRAGERQKTLAKEQQGKKVRVEGGSQPGDTSSQINLSPQERKLAKAFGLTPKEWANEKQKQQKRGRK